MRLLIGLGNGASSVPVTALVSGWFAMLGQNDLSKTWSILYQKAGPTRNSGIMELNTSHFLHVFIFFCQLSCTSP
jgi:hypothetical protein